MNNPQPTHRSLTGIVTKLVGDGATYGFINDEIFFPQTNVVSGGPASVGDQVFAECEYSAHLPIKWNATSVKILNKAAIGGQNQANSGEPNQHMSNQQQQQFNQAPPVADTYLQHRRQQRQLLDTDSRPENKLLPQQQQQMNEPPPTGRLLDQTQPDFFAPPGVPGGGFPHPNQPQMQPQEAAGLAPFQNQPMDGANFTFTSQPGSAFVQNQFLPPPFLPQQGPPPMLAQSQHLLPQNNQASNNQNQRNNMHGNKGGGNRFGGGGGNNMETKNDRQQNRNRNQNRNNENRMRSGDREGPTDRSRGNNNNNNNNNSNNSQNSNNNQNSSRDRSTGRGGGGGGKKEAPSRPTPPPPSSARSTTSSDRVVKSSRRHYEPQNIPKTKIMTNMNAYNMKQRCPASVHVPSDLKDIIVNKYFRLDIKNTPKPLRFIIEEAESGKSIVKKEEPTKAAVTDDKANDNNEGDEKQIDKKPEVEKTDAADTSNKQGENTPEKAEQVKSSQEQPTPPSSKSDIRLNHKYGVKVILISLPELDAIYRKVFGTDLESFTNDNSKIRSRLDETISLLCNKGINNGHSLIGGKFDPILDGFVEGKRNRFERHARHPDLIATCKRVTLEQTGLDLGPCRSWSLLSTFIYNNKTEYFSSKASVEYSFIYMPQIWTMLKDNLEANLTSIPPDLAPAPSDKKEEQQHDSSNTQMDISITANQAEEKDEREEEEEGEGEEKKGDVSEAEKKKMIEDENAMPRPATQNSSMETPSSSFDKNSIYEMKRDDLKIELDKRNIKYKLNAKKGELLVLLEEVLKNEKEEDSNQTAPKSTDGDALVDEQATSDSTQLEEGEVVENDPSEDSKSEDSEMIQKTEGIKRKSEDDAEEPQSSKKICTEQETSPITSTNKEQRVELISEAFFVKSREQQQLSLVSLYEASQSKSRHDQFELSVASNILKESLIQHLSEYILTTLVEDNKQNNFSANPPGSLSSSQNQQQESSNSIGNDANNNSNKSTTLTISRDSKVNVIKEYPVDRYINLAFSYFDSTHMGYVYSDDLNKLFNNTDLTISKRALASLIGDGEKFTYRTLADLSPKLPAAYIYEFPEQFRQLPPDRDSGDSSSSKSAAESATKMIEYKGVVYDIERLTQEVKDAETLRVSMVDRFNYAIENSDKQAEEIHVLEVSQKSLSKAIKSQNDEICDLKRERDSIKKKYDSLRKAIKGSIGSLSDLIKEDK